MFKRLAEIRLAGIGLAQCAGCLAELALQRVTRSAHVGKLGDEIGIAAGQTLDVGAGGLIVAPRGVKRGSSGLECAGCVAEAALERVTRGTHVAKLGDEVGFATGQALDIGCCGLIVAAGLVKCRLRLGQAPGQTLALGRCGGEGALVPLLRIAQDSLGIGDRLLEKIAPVLKVGELRGKVGFPCGQSFAIG